MINAKQCDTRLGSGKEAFFFGKFLFLFLWTSSSLNVRYFYPLAKVVLEC